MYTSAPLAAGLKATSDNRPLIVRGRDSGSIVAASKAAHEVIYVRQLLTELGFPPTGPTPQGCDNKAARDTAYNPENHERMKHVERRHLYIRECIERG